MDKNIKAGKELDINEKYYLYEQSVQCPSGDIEFFVNEYQRFYNEKPRVVREDFCGTANLCAEWVRSGKDNIAWGIDLDPVPLKYGKEHHFAKLTPEQKERLHFVEEDVLKLPVTGMGPTGAPPAAYDVILALNFSYCFLKKRKDLAAYFSSVRKSMHKKSMLVLDIFGGKDSMYPNINEIEHEEEGFTYFWDCDRFNPLTHDGLYKIHFKKAGDDYKYEDVFVYDWRLWTVPELKDLLTEVGFSKVYSYWEADDENGEGSGDFFIVDKPEDANIASAESDYMCDSWISYIVALP